MQIARQNKGKGNKKQKTMKEQNLAEEFRKIIDNMSDEELNQKLKELEPLHNIGPKADEYLEFLEENKQKFNNTIENCK